MKKLLSILAAVGLTATASTAVVACTTKEVKAKQMDVTVDAKKEIYTVKTKKAITVKLADKAKKEVAKDSVLSSVDDLTAAFGANFGIFDKDGKDMINADNKTAFADMTVKVTVDKKIKKDAKQATIKVEFTLSAKDAVSLGLAIAENAKGEDVNAKTKPSDTTVVKYAKGTDLKVTLGSKTSDDKLDKTVVKADFDASKFAFTIAKN